MRHFWRVQATNDDKEGDDTFNCSPELLSKLRPKHGLVLSRWDEVSLTGQVIALGVVESVKSDAAKIEWRECEITLKPNPGGRQFWRKKPFFRFADAVAARYMLDDLFAEHFPDMSELNFEVSRPPAGRTSSGRHQVIEGFVYLIRSQYGYKIGKTVNIKSRYRIFGVKLPFPIELIHYARFEDYTGAERNLHDHFAHKRLEGEWFDLNDDDVSYIKSKGEPMSLEGLI